jgi:hypothetical protein
LRSALEPDDEKIFHPTTYQDVFDVAWAIQDAQAKGQRLRNPRRMELFLTALNKLSAAIDALWHENCYVSYIWVL